MNDLTDLDPPRSGAFPGDDWALYPTGSGVSWIDPAGAPRPKLLRLHAVKGAAMSMRAGDAVRGTPYAVIRGIGQGGMGEVYEVEHREAGFRGALKVLHPKHRDRADLVERMWREADALATIDHPGVVRLLDLGQVSDGRPFLVMELLAGRDLREVLDEAGPMDVDAALLAIAEALDALSAVHAAGIVHRDVKLENLFVCRDGRIKILDFGVAKARGAGASPTAPGFSPGTPRAMAPEQCSRGGIDPRADLYAAGIALYELCAGRGPFDDLRHHPQALRSAHCTRQPPSPAEVAAQPIPRGVEAAILRALAKSPADRFQSASEMAAALRRLVRRQPAVTEAIPDTSPPEAPDPPIVPRHAPSPTRRGMTLLPELLLLLLLLFFALGLILGCALSDPRPKAASSVARALAELVAIRCKAPETSALFSANEDGRTR